MTTDTLSLKKTDKLAARKSNTTGYRIKHKTRKNGTGISLAAFATERHKIISEAAYYRFEKRGSQSGLDILDWLEAEKDIDNSMEKAANPVSA